MINMQTAVSPEVLCKALKDVLALEFDFESPSELAAAAVLSQKLMANSEVADMLAKFVARHSMGEGYDAHRTRGANFSVLLRSQTTVDQDVSPLDWPTEASSERVNGLGFYNIKVVNDISQGMDAFEDGERVAQRNYHFVIYSPEVLGFSAGTPKVDWSNTTADMWGHFFWLAEESISARATVPKKPKSNYLARAVNLVRNQFLFSAEHKARNYSVVEYCASSGKTHIHVLYDPDTLYVVVTRNEATTLRSRVHIENPDYFAREIVDVFGGHKDEAMRAITSLRQELTH